MNEQRSAETFAAVDLGSNSFHMVVARFAHDKAHVLDRLRDRVRLAAGLDADRNLDAETQARALETLARFGERLRNVPPSRVRAVGTNTFRQARNSRAFLKDAEQALGHRIEIVSGQEEARLIYLGVAHSLPDPSLRHLVVDIGGGSTECIIGEGFTPLRAVSLYMGCVSYSQRYFPNGEIGKQGLREAETAAMRELEAMGKQFLELGWDVAVGSSGTVHAIESILDQSGWNSDEVVGVVPRGIRKLRKALLAAGHIDRLSLPGLTKERAPVLPGGLAILSAAFECLRIDRMKSTRGALREGVLYDLVGRSRHDDIRDRTIASLMLQHQVDRAQADRVERTTRSLWAGVAPDWQLDPPDLELEKLLIWAARVHEIGLSISYSGYHKHGAYLIENSDLPGMSRDLQQALAVLLYSHRRKVRAELFEQLAHLDARSAFRLCVLLRLAVLLNRSRSPRALPEIALRGKKASLELRIPEEWLAENPLTRADIEDEAATLAKAGFRLELESRAAEG